MSLPFPEETLTTYYRRHLNVWISTIEIRNSQQECTNLDSRFVYIPGFFFTRSPIRHITRLNLYFYVQILDSEEEYERFLQRSVDRARQLLAKHRDGGSFQCRRPDCTGWCLIYDKNNVFEFKCPVCGTVTCVQCGVSTNPCCEWQYCPWKSVFRAYRTSCIISSRFTNTAEDAKYSERTTTPATARARRTARSR